MSGITSGRWLRLLAVALALAVGCQKVHTTKVPAKAPTAKSDSRLTTAAASFASREALDAAVARTIGQPGPKAYDILGCREARAVKTWTGGGPDDLLAETDKWASSAPLTLGDEYTLIFNVVVGDQQGNLCLEVIGGRVAEGKFIPDTMPAQASRRR
jgi:hypothetical protein